MGLPRQRRRLRRRYARRRNCPDHYRQAQSQTSPDSKGRRFMPAMHGRDAASLVPRRGPAFRHWALAFRLGAGHRRANGGDTGALFPSFASNTHARRLLRRPLELGCPARAVKRREGRLRRLVRRYEAVRLRSCLPHRSPALHVSSTKPDSPAFPAIHVAVSNGCSFSWHARRVGTRSIITFP